MFLTKYTATERFKITSKKTFSAQTVLSVRRRPRIRRGPGLCCSSGRPRRWCLPGSCWTSRYMFLPRCGVASSSRRNRPTTSNSTRRCAALPPPRRRRRWCWRTYRLPKPDALTNNCSSRFAPARARSQSKTNRCQLPQCVASSSRRGRRLTATSNYCSTRRCPVLVGRRWCRNRRTYRRLPNCALTSCSARLAPTRSRNPSKTTDRRHLRRVAAQRSPRRDP